MKHLGVLVLEAFVRLLPMGAKGCSRRRWEEVRRRERLAAPLGPSSLSAASHSLLRTDRGTTAAGTLSLGLVCNWAFAATTRGYCRMVDVGKG